VNCFTGTLGNVGKGLTGIGLRQVFQAVEWAGHFIDAPKSVGWRYPDFWSVREAILNNLLLKRAILSMVTSLVTCLLF
jgi:hypothetical protein